jgi:perosamine synthetase
VTKNTKAILPVHLYGNPCNMNRIKKIADTYGLSIIEDATESFGALYKGRHTGMFGDFGCFSFNGNKIITTGGGGMVVGHDIIKLDRIKSLVNQAKDKTDSLYHPEIGFNYRMTNIEAALGLAQLEKVDRFLQKRRRINGIYREVLADVDRVRFQEEHEGGQSSWWFTCVTLARTIDVVVLQGQLKKWGIPTRRVFMPITGFPPYRKYKNNACKRSHELYRHGL